MATDIVLETTMVSQHDLVSTRLSLNIPGFRHRGIIQRPRPKDMQELCNTLRAWLLQWCYFPPHYSKLHDPDR